MPDKKQLNHWIIAALVVVHQLFSALWYSPYLFGSRWINASGFRFSQNPAADNLAFYWPLIFSIITSVLLCYALAIAFIKFNVVSIKKGLKWAFIAWFVFSFLNMLTHNLFAQRPLALTLIDGGRDAILFLLAGLVISAYAIRKRYD